MTPYKKLFTEGVWSTPFDSLEKAQQFTTLMSSPILLGNRYNGVEKLLYKYVGDDDLFDKISKLRRVHLEDSFDIREIIKDTLRQWISEYKSSPEKFKSAKKKL